MFYQILQFIEKYKFYCYSFFGLVIWLTFVDDNDFGATIRLHKKAAQLERELDFYNDRIAEVNHDRSQVLGTAELREKYARERYFMKKPNEEVFVLVDKDNNLLKK
jgi:cell division protein DivIC